MKLLDLSKFEKIAEGKHTATMKHKDGHTMTILLPALPKIQREQLKRLKMASGGDPADAKDLEDADAVFGQTHPDPSQYITGTDSGNVGDTASATEPSTPSAPTDNSGALRFDAEIIHNKDGSMTIVKKNQRRDPASDVTAQQDQPAPDLSHGMNITAGSPDVNAPPESSQSTGTPIPENTPLPWPEDATIHPPVTLPQNAAALQAKGLGEQVLGEQQKQAVSSATSQDLENIAAKQGNQAQWLNADILQTIQDIRNHTDDYKQHLESQPIDENQIFKQMPMGQKIATSIGLILGGFDRNGNQALKYLQDQQNKNIAAQRENMGAQNNIMAAYQHLYGDENVSANLARVSNNDQIIAATKAMMAKVNTPMSIAEGNALIGKLMGDSAQKITDSAYLLNSGNIRRLPSQPGVTNNNVKQQYNDQGLVPGSAHSPELPQTPQIHFDYDRLKRSQYLGAHNVPNEIMPAEVSAANDEANQFHQTNGALRQIDDAMGEMWKNSGPNDYNDIAKIGHGQSLFGAHIPDFGNWSQGAKRYFTAASTVKKQLNNILKGGGSPEIFSLIEDQLPRGNDTPADFRQKVDNIHKIVLQQLPTAMSRKYGLASGLPRE